MGQLVLWPKDFGTPCETDEKMEKINYAIRYIWAFLCVACMDDSMYLVSSYVVFPLVL